MELASAGISVDLYDKNDRCVAQTSARNEGKIHLGYVYASDRTLRTARTLVKGAVAFSPLMRRWLGHDLDTIPISTPFYYAVHADSQLTIDEIETYFKSTHAIAAEEGQGAQPDYFGSDYRVAPTRMPKAERESLFDGRAVTAAFKTSEIAIDSAALAAIVRARLSADAKIQCLLQARVHGVEPTGDGVVVDFEKAGQLERSRYDHVVNALWDGRLAIDKTAGLEPERAWLYRVKHYLRLRAPALASVVPSTTIVLGAFGDIAAYGSGDLHLSWYPASMRDMSSALSPPAWPLDLDEPASIEMRRAILEGLTRVVPAVADLAPEMVECWHVKAGIIFAWGESDIYDRASGLHARYAIGPRSRGRYHSVDTGKLTMAPLFGKMIADRIREAG
jgi:hypothetical protein